jgi:hypothetical protein
MFEPKKLSNKSHNVSVNIHEKDLNIESAKYSETYSKLSKF